MRYRCWWRHVLVGSLLCVGTTGCKSDAPKSWIATDLGPGRCLALNGRGQVLGIDDSNTTFILAKDGTRTTLPSSDPDVMIIGAAIADSGDVVGYSEGMNGRRAMRYGGGAWSAVAGLGDPPWSVALAFSDQGELVGMLGSDTAGNMRGFLSSGGALAPLPLPTDKNSAAYVALGGRVAGIFETPAGATHGFVTDAGQLKDLGTLGGDTSAAYAMNRRGDIVGAAETADGHADAFFAAHGGKLIDAAPRNSAASDARGVDDQGHVAVNALDAKGMSRPSVFIAGGSSVDLMPLDADKQPWVSAHVAAMAPDGRIVGWGVRPTVDEDGGEDNGIHCLLWTQGGR